MTDVGNGRPGRAAVIGGRSLSEAWQAGWLHGTGRRGRDSGSDRGPRLGALVAVLGALALVAVAAVVLATGGLYWGGALFLGATLIGTDRYDRWHGRGAPGSRPPRSARGITGPGR